MKKKKKQIKEDHIRVEENNIFEPDKSGSRREFLIKLWKWLGVIAAAETSAVFLGFLFSGKNENKGLKPKQLLNAGSIDSFKNNTVTVFRGGRFYLARLDDGGFIALSLRCTHLGCSINWHEDKKRFICPCHSSAFYINGEVQNPPAPNALDYYPVIIESGYVKVDTGTKLARSRFEKSQVTYT